MNIPRLHPTSTFLAGSVLALVLAASTTSAGAATITVNALTDTQADDGDCTLREAIMAANNGFSSGSSPGECVGGEPDPIIDRVAFAAGLTGTIMLASGLPSINDPVEIVGPGSADLVVDGSGIATRAFQTMDKTLIEGLAIVNVTTASSGGGIDANQPLTLRDVIIENNTASDGGGIKASADLTVENCVFRNNVATDFSGGGIRFADAANTLIVRDSLFEGNQATVDARGGGAIEVGGSDHITVISGSTFTGNVVAGTSRRGGAIRIGGASLTVTNSTFSDNRAGHDGGGIYAATQSSTLINVTVSGNQVGADGDGGGVYALGPVAVRNSLIAGNMDTGGEAPDCSGSFTSEGYNLIGIEQGCTGFTNGTSGDQVGTAATPLEPLLGALEDNGGPTPTRGLLAGSPAIDAGNPAGCIDANDAALVEDQRGRARPLDGDEDGTADCDAGAFEYMPPTIFRDRFEN